MKLKENKRQKTLIFLCLSIFFINAFCYLISGKNDALWVLMVVTMPLIAYKDFDKHIVKNIDILGISIIYTLFTFAIKEKPLLEIAMAVFMLVVFTIIFYLSKEQIGGADVKSMYFLSLGVGKGNILLFLLLGCVLTFVLQNILKELHKKEMYLDFEGVPFLGMLAVVLGLVFII